MQKDYTVFKIPNQPRKQADDFAVRGTETMQVGGVTTGRLSYKPADGVFTLYEELNNIAEELEKCRLRNS